MLETLIFQWPIIRWSKIVMQASFDILRWEWDLTPQAPSTGLRSSVDSKDTQRVRCVLWRTVLRGRHSPCCHHRSVSHLIYSERLSAVQPFASVPPGHHSHTHTHCNRLLLGVTGCGTHTLTLKFFSIQHPLPFPAVIITECDFWMSKCSLTAFCPPRVHLSDAVLLCFLGFQRKSMF